MILSGFASGKYQMEQYVSLQLIDDWWYAVFFLMQDDTADMLVFAIFIIIRYQHDRLLKLLSSLVWPISHQACVFFSRNRWQTK